MRKGKKQQHRGSLHTPLPTLEFHNDIEIVIRAESIRILTGRTPTLEEIESGYLELLLDLQILEGWLEFHTEDRSLLAGHGVKEGG